MRLNGFGCLTFIIVLFLIYHYKGDVDRLMRLKLAEAEHHAQCHKGAGCHGGHE
jgi:hypothetical protein